MHDLNYKDKYKKEAVPKLKADFGYKNDLAVPKIEKIVVNVGVGKMGQQTGFQDKILPEVIKSVANITGQKPQTTAAKKSISGFKLRQGQVVGIKATLRGKRMYDFLKKLITIVFPRVKDFRGVSLENIDKQGNLSVGFKENVVFPEINAETSKADFGVEVTMVSKVKNQKEAVELYKLMGFPFKSEEDSIRKRK